MEWCYLFLSTFFCFFNVVFTSEYGSLEKPQSETVPKINGNACFEEFISNAPSLMKFIQSETLECNARATKRKESDLVILSEFNSQTSTKVKDLHEFFNSCNLKEENSDYFECLKSFDSKSRQILDEIKEQSETLASSSGQMEDEKSRCLNRIVGENNLKASNLFSDLKQCLSKTDDSSLKSPQPLSSLSPELDKLTQIYKTLETCAKNLNRKQFEIFDDCWRKIKIDDELKDYLVKNAADFFEKLTELDHKDNACLRHFITRYVYESHKQGFNLEKCLTQGLSKANYRENGNYRVVQEYSKLHNLLSSCRVNLNESAIELCISDVLKNDQDVSDVLQTSHSLSENYLKQIYETISKTFNNEDTCMGYVFESLQFKGIFMKASVKDSMKECFARNYVSSKSPATAMEVITRLRLIQAYITRHCKNKVSERKLPQCITDAVAAHSSSLDYIISSPLYEEEYKSYIIQHDIRGISCFEQMISGNKAKSYLPVIRCIKGSFH